MAVEVDPLRSRLRDPAASDRSGAGSGPDDDRQVPRVMRWLPWASFAAWLVMNHPVRALLGTILRVVRAAG